MPRIARLGGGGLRKENDPLLLVLISLVAGPKHGHALLDDIEGFTGTRLGPGTLYGAITRLEEQGLIEPLEPVGRRRPYRITASGVAATRQVLDATATVVSAGKARLRGLGAETLAIPPL
jgi:DNA-binding PadR family transcriptional regulator